MDDKLKKLLEDAKEMAVPEVIGQGGGASDAAEMILALRMAVKEQDKRARHAEHERDLYNQRITELETEREQIVRACLGREVDDGLPKQVLGLWKSQASLNERVAELEALTKKQAHLLSFAAYTLENAADILEDDDIDEETPEVREHIIQMWELLGGTEGAEGVKRVKEAMAKAPRSE